MAPLASELPAKKQSKWSADEDALIIELRGSGMKWEDISKRLPGRSAISCRLHYQNYLERRAEWDEEKKNKLARLYERFKPEIWSKVADEMGTPWRAVEAMHWQMGDAEMARRAGVVPFSMTSVPIDGPLAPPQRPSPPHGVAYPRAHPPATIIPAHDSSSRFHSSIQLAPSGSRSVAARRDSTPRAVSSPIPSQMYLLPGIIGVTDRPTSQTLPSVAELATGAMPYSTSGHSVNTAIGSTYVSPRLPVSSSGYRPVSAVLPSTGDGKRRASPDMLPRETSRRKK